MYVTFINNRKQYIKPSIKDMYNSRSFLKDTIEKAENYTIQTDEIPDLNKVYKLTEILKYLNELYTAKDKYTPETSYHTFSIPKHSGGFRQICAPDDDFKEYLRDINTLFSLMHILPTNNAYAYVKGRSTIDAIKKHQENTSHWFLKLDIHDFFGSCTEEFVLTQLNQIYPITTLIQNNQFKEQFPAVLHMCFLNGVLPQGSPVSPTLCNLVMVPFDFAFNLYCQHNHFVYTRYADDLTVSCFTDFNKENVISKINHLLPPELKLNETKTRYGSSSGRNWNLGLMLNKDNNITIGYKKKKLYKISINNLFNDYTKGIKWNIMDLQELLGITAYYKSVEPEYFNSLINKYENKYQLSFKEITKFA